MPNYQEAAVSGTKFKRCNAATISNELGQVPSIRFIEEDVVELGDGTVIKTPASSVQINLSDPSAVFDRLDPTTDGVAGSFSYQEVYILLYSLYRHAAGLRDGGVI